MVEFEEVPFNLSENIGKTCNILISLSASWVKAFSASASDNKSYNMEFYPSNNKDRFCWIEVKVKYFLRFVLEKYLTAFSGKVVADSTTVCLITWSCSVASASADVQ